MHLVKRQRKVLVRLVEAGGFSQAEWGQVDNDTRNVLVNHRLVKNDQPREIAVVPTKKGRQLVAEWKP